MKVMNILLVGVGGQGTILAAKILSKAALNAGLDVKMSEIHGMSQRGGSVSTHVRFGDRIYSPVIPKGEADIIVSFEKMEALRYLDFLKENGTIIVADYEIPSLPILTGAAEYPEGIIETLRKNSGEVIVVDVKKTAEELGSEKVINVVLLGKLKRKIEQEIDFEQALKESVKPEFIELNLRALNYE